eukprot:2618257-Pyramimonas_sp.AAC.2
MVPTNIAACAQSMHAHPRVSRHGAMVPTNIAACAQSMHAHPDSGQLLSCHGAEEHRSLRAINGCPPRLGSVAQLRGILSHKPGGGRPARTSEIDRLNTIV